mgnify:CR=1 FL=1
MDISQTIVMRKINVLLHLISFRHETGLASNMFVGNLTRTSYSISSYFFLFLFNLVSPASLISLPLRFLALFGSSVFPASSVDLSVVSS